jgi:hypothetical protein
MPTPNTGVRTRAGCWTYRIRQKKCDETRPHCVNCSDLELACEGYKIRLKWLQQHKPLAERPQQRNDNPPRIHSISNSRNPGLDSTHLVYYLGRESFETLIEMHRVVLQDCMYFANNAEPESNFRQLSTGALLNWSQV